MRGPQIAAMMTLGVERAVRAAYVELAQARAPVDA